MSLHIETSVYDESVQVCNEATGETRLGKILVGVLLKVQITYIGFSEPRSEQG